MLQCPWRYQKRIQTHLPALQPPQELKSEQTHYKKTPFFPETIQWMSSSCIPLVTISPWAWWCTRSNTQNTRTSIAISIPLIAIYLSKDNTWPSIARLSLTVRYREPERDIMVSSSRSCIELFNCLCSLLIESNKINYYTVAVLACIIE